MFVFICELLHYFVDALESGWDALTHRPKHIYYILARHALRQLQLVQDYRVAVALQRLHALKPQMVLLDRVGLLRFRVLGRRHVLDDEKGDLAVLPRLLPLGCCFLASSLWLAHACHFFYGLSCFLISLNQALQIYLALHELGNLAKLCLHCSRPVPALIFKFLSLGGVVERFYPCISLT